MSDVIDFREIRNKITDRDREEFREFIFNLYEKISRGNVFVGDLNDEIWKYGESKNISKEKISKLREELIKELTLEAGINMSIISDKMDDYEGVFCEEYDDISIKGILRYEVFNGKNNMQVLIEDSKVYIFSQEEPDLQDSEFLSIVDSYKRRENLKEVQVVFMKEIYRSIL